MVLSGELWTYLWPSLVVLAIGFAFAVVFGIGIGLLLARFWVLDVALTVYITFLYSIPSVALVPLIVLWAGFDTTAKVIILFLFAFFPMVINTYQGVKSVDPKLLEVGRAFRCSEGQLWGNIVLPASLPFIVTGLRLALGRGLIGMVLADLYTAISGIGYLIVRTAGDLPGRQDVRADRDARPAGRDADGAAAPRREIRRALDRGVARGLEHDRRECGTIKERAKGTTPCRNGYRIDLSLPRRWRRSRSRSARCGERCAAQNCPTMRKINIGVSVAPPNVVHTSPYVAKELGFFAKRCIDANIIQFEGGQSATANAAAAQGSAIVSVSDVAIGRGMKVQQFWGFAPRMPQAYMVSPDVKTAADLKGKKLSATGGGVGGFNWRMGREVLKTAGLTVDDAQFIPAATAGRLPGLIAGQIDGVALHPEDVFLAKKQKPTLNVLVQLADLMPNYMFNAYGASLDWIARDRALLRDTAAAMIEANRTMYRDKAKVVPIIEKATEKPKDAVEYAIDVLTKNCVWSVNGGLNPKRTQWSIDNSAENGDIDKDKKPTVEQVANFALAKEAVEAAGGPVTIGNCKD